MNTLVSLSKKAIITLLVTGAMLCAKNVVKDMILTTPDGIDILLRGDNTWIFQGQKKPEIEQDFTVPLHGGRVVLVSMDGTWSFVKDEIKREKELITVDTIIGKGHAVHADIAVANAKAMNQANAIAIQRMKQALRNIKINPVKLADCVRRVEKDVDKKEEFKKGSGWNVSLTMTLDRGSILAVAECAMKEKEKEPGVSDTSTMKK